MKKLFFIFLLALLALAVPQSAGAGGSLKIVTGTVTTSKGAVPVDEDFSFEAYILGRDGDILRQNSVGCGYSTGSWWITVSNFAGTWAIDETLRVSFADAGSGESNVLEIVLDGSTTQNVGDFSLPVELSLFTATVSSAGVLLRWRTESEVNNIGFAIYRGEARGGPYTKIAFVDGAGSSAMPRDYQYLDKTVEKGKTYFYYLEDVDVAGEKGKSEIIKIVAGPPKRMATVWSRIRAAR